MAPSDRPGSLLSGELVTGFMSSMAWRFLGSAFAPYRGCLHTYATARCTIANVLSAVAPVAHSER
jgi:hypothetical protein